VRGTGGTGRGHGTSTHGDDAVTAAVTSGDADAIAPCYAEYAVADTPAAGRIAGREAIAQYLMSFSQALSDMSFETSETLENGSIAIDEGPLIGRHTGTLRTPEGRGTPTRLSAHARARHWPGPAEQTHRGGLP
jgi:hypothetical protein